MKSLSTKIFSLFIIILFFNCICKAQVDFFAENKRKVEQAIEKSKQFPTADTNRVLALIEVMRATRFKSERILCMPYYEEALALSKKLSFRKGELQCKFFFASYQLNLKNYEQAHAIFDTIISLTRNDKDDYFGGVFMNAHIVKGNMYKITENFYSALKCYFVALDYYKMKKGLKYYNNVEFIANIYWSLQNREKAKMYTELQYEAALQIKDSVLIFGSGLNMANIYIELGNPMMANKYLDSIKPIILVLKDNVDGLIYYRNLAVVNYQQDKYDSSAFHFAKAMESVNKFGHGTMACDVLINYAITEIKRKKFENAKKYLTEGLAIANAEKSLLYKMQACKAFSTCWHELGNEQKAFEYANASLALNDSILSETNLRQNNTLAAVYETELKEKQIAKLELEGEMKNTYLAKKARQNTILFGSMAALCLLGFLGYRNFRSNQKLQQAKITELEKDKQLVAIDAMLRGQEEERSRIAKDLHDGLGGMLSGTKLSFMNMKENLVMTQENASLFDKSLSMLDNTIGDLRKVAQNLMPEALVKFGLEEALKDYCLSIESSSQLQVEYHFLGEQRALSNTAKVFIYRIVQELVNNAVKHAAAKKLLVQLNMQVAKVDITVEDDGKGYDVATVAQKKGAGLSNIQYRVQYFNGKIDTVTKPGEGTSMHIELNV